MFDLEWTKEAENIYHSLEQKAAETKNKREKSKKTKAQTKKDSLTKSKRPFNI